MIPLEHLFPKINFVKVTDITIGAVFLFLIIIIFIPIDITTEGEGQTILSKKIRSIQVFDASTILSVYVKEKQRIKKGDLLFKLDSESLNNELRNLKKLLTICNMTEKRILAILENDVPDFTKITDDNKLIQTELNIYLQEKNTFEAKKNFLKSQISAKMEEENSIKHSIEFFKNLSNLAKDYLDRLEILYQKGAISWTSKYEIHKQYIDAYSQMEMKKASLKSCTNQRMAHEQELALFISNFKKKKQIQLEENIRKKDTITKEINNIKEKLKKTKIYAEFDGVIFDLDIHEKSVVPSSQVIAKIVPENEPIEVESVMNKKNCGLVSTGQQAIIKLRSFPYQIYGTIKGKIVSVSPVSTNDTKNSPGLLVRIILQKNEIQAHDRKIPLTPLMPLEAVITVDKMTLAKYLWMYFTRK